MKNLYFDGDFWLLPGDANDEAGLLLWPNGRCPIKEKPIEFREIYCSDLSCICNEVRLLAIDRSNGDENIASARLKLEMDDPDDIDFKLTWSGSSEPPSVQSAFIRVLETEHTYLEHLKALHMMIRRASRHHESLGEKLRA